jgi:hypothetical protein
MFYNKVLGKKLRATKEDVTSQWINLHRVELLHDVKPLQTLLTVQTGHVAGVGTRSERDRTLVGEDGKEENTRKT